MLQLELKRFRDRPRGKQNHRQSKATGGGGDELILLGTKGGDLQLDGRLDVFSSVNLPSLCVLYRLG